MNKIIVLVVIIVIVIILLWFYRNTNNINHLTIAQLTDQWCDLVVNQKDPEQLGAMFCENGSLVATVSQIKRQSEDIKKYFDFFVHLPNLQIINKVYNIDKVAHNIHLNTAFITWFWKGLDQPLTTRMTFLFRDHCIFQLHSSTLPEFNPSLMEISGRH